MVAEVFALRVAEKKDLRCCFGGSLLELLKTWQPVKHPNK